MVFFFLMTHSGIFYVIDLGTAGKKNMAKDIKILKFFFKFKIQNSLQ